MRDAVRYLTPLREGGSLPAVVETADDRLWVVKFRGSGQGPLALVAEILVGGLAAAVGLRVPEIALISLDEAFGRGERDPEIQDLLRASEGVNVGLAYLDGAFNLDPAVVPEAVDEALATRLVWLDALVTNPDRTPRNPNLMLWEGAVWLIDHGAALFDHHNWSRVTEERTRRPFDAIADHVLLHRAGDVTDADPTLAAALGPDLIESVVARVPDALLADPHRDETATPDEQRARYVDYLTTRLEAPRAFAAAAEDARQRRLREPVRRLESRR